MRCVKHCGFILNDEQLWWLMHHLKGISYFIGNVSVIQQIQIVNLHILHTFIKQFLKSLDHILLIPQRVECLKISTVSLFDCSLISASWSSEVSGIQFTLLLSCSLSVFPKIELNKPILFFWYQSDTKMTHYDVISKLQIYGFI